MIKDKIQGDLVCVAKVGRCVGVRGEVLLHLITDFPQSIKKGYKFYSNFGILELESYHQNRSLAKFSNIDSREEVQKLTNAMLYVSKSFTRELCELKENEFFWFDILGSKVYENELFLGEVSDIERFGSEDYLIIKTAKNLQKENLAKTFMIPYTERYILNVKDNDPKDIYVQHSRVILENS